MALKNSSTTDSYSLRSPRSTLDRRERIALLEAEQVVLNKRLAALDGRHEFRSIGDQNPTARLTDADVRAARWLRRWGFSVADIRKHLSLPISLSATRAMLNGDTWKHVADYPEFKGKA